MLALPPVCPVLFHSRHLRASIISSNYVPSQSLTWNLKMVPWNRRFLLETLIFRFHVKLGECIEDRSILRESVGTRSSCPSCTLNESPFSCIEVPIFSQLQLVARHKLGRIPGVFVLLISKGWVLVSL